MTVPVAIEAAETLGSAEAGAGLGGEAGGVAKKAAPSAGVRRTAPAPGPTRAPQKKTQPSRGRSRGGGGTPGGFKLPAGQGAHRILVAEFALCVVMIGMTPVVMRKPDDQGRLYMPNDIVRISAVTIIFFTLALLSNNRGGSRFAAAFGALITLGVLYNTAGSLKVVGEIFAGSSKTGAVQSADAGTATVAKPTFTPVDLGANPLAQAAGAAPGSPVPPTGAAT